MLVQRLQCFVQLVNVESSCRQSVKNGTEIKQNILTCLPIFKKNSPSLLLDQCHIQPVTNLLSKLRILRILLCRIDANQSLRQELHLFVHRRFVLSLCCKFVEQTCSFGEVFCSLVVTPQQLEIMQVGVVFNFAKSRFN